MNSIKNTVYKVNNKPKSIKQFKPLNDLLEIIDNDKLTVEILEKYINLGLNINDYFLLKINDWYYEATLLMYIIHNNKVKSAITLINYGIKNGLNFYKTFRSLSISPLIVAIRKGYYYILKLLINANIHNINKKNYGLSPLLYALQYNFNYDNNILFKIIKLMINSKSRLNVLNSNNQSPLILAIINKDITHNKLNTIVKLLLDNNCDIDRIDKFGNTPLHYAAKYSNSISTNKVVNMLINSGVNVNYKDKEGNTALMIACQYSNTTSSIDTIQTLLKQGANINLYNNKHESALMIAINNLDCSSSFETIELLINYNIELTGEDSYGNNIMMIAAKKLNLYNFRKVSNLLMNKGININYQNHNGNNCLIISAKHKKILNTLYLLSLHNINKNIKNNNNKSYLDYIDINIFNLNDLKHEHKKYLDLESCKICFKEIINYDIQTINNNFNYIVILNCKHNMCIECYNYLINNNELKCPYCRKDIIIKESLIIKI